MLQRPQQRPQEVIDEVAPAVASAAAPIVEVGNQNRDARPAHAVRYRPFSAVVWSGRARRRFGPDPGPSESSRRPGLCKGRRARMMASMTTEPRYLTALRVVMLPRDTNQYGTIFGGVILSYIDQAGFIEARRHGRHRWVTAS
ncbi:MAG: hotdog domain-containing protein, partial [Alphaproteobacteria bacterium]